ncbi:MAG TPA: hypothetical protein VMG13_09150 [Trebonia sp.]|nr:hypothetical protein [Trebonia sp.]
MRQLTAGLALVALAATGCAATASSSKTPAAPASHSATPATGTTGTASAAPGVSGLSGGGPGGPAQWVVDGTFQTVGSPAQPLSGVITFHDSTTGQTATVTVGASGKFSLGLIAGTYTATGQTKKDFSPCSAPVTVTVRAGQLTRVSLSCKAGS